MSVNERLRVLRKELGLSQKAFGEKIGLGKDVIVNIELSRTELKPLTQNLICRTFHVNPLWLERGIGDHFIEVPDTLLDEIAEEFDLSPTEKNIVTNYLRMSPEDRRKVADLLHKLIE